MTDDEPRRSIKRKDLEMKLQKVPKHPDPKAELEQYSTPADIAADILFTALTQNDILNKDVADLGCGTGIFTLGAALLDADMAIGVDLDKDAMMEGKKMADDWGLDVVEFIESEITDIAMDVDTVIMNPPFGSQKKGADLPFLNKAFEISSTVYSLHNAKTIEFLRDFVDESCFHIFGEKRYMFEIDKIFDFHEKEKDEFEVVLLVLKKENGFK